MSLFLLIFLGFYTFLHTVVFWGVYPLLKGRRIMAISCVVWIVLMMISPIAAVSFEVKGFESVASVLSWVGYTWLGLILLAFNLFFLLAIWEVVARTLVVVKPSLAYLSLRSKLCSKIVVIIVVCAFMYGFYEASNIRVEHVKLETQKLASGSEKIVVAQVSDMHLGLMLREGHLRTVISKLKEINPDVIVATGDIVDAQVDQLNDISSLWDELNPSMGKFAVTGNHEYHGGLENSLKFFEDSGFVVLRAQAKVVGGLLNVAGVDDVRGGFASDDVATLKHLQNGNFTILLKHRPVINPDAVELFDLQLSGHTHGGQIFPFNFLTGMKFPMQYGLYELQKGSFLYVNRGTGTWGPPIRIGSPPEITVFEIYGK